MKSLLLLLGLNVFSVTLLHATSDTLYPEVGKPCPEFILKNVNYYKKKEITLSDFNGKWLVLDFWNKYCSACVGSFPSTNAMQKKFGDRVQFVLVGYQDREEQIKTMYERFRKKLNLILPCAFDSTLSNYWGIYSDPHIVIIDDKGVVQAVTYKLDSTDIEKLLLGQRPTLPVINYLAERPDGSYIGEKRTTFNSKRPYMINDNGGKSDADYLFRSVLTKWDQATQHYYKPINIYLDPVRFPTSPRGLFQVLGASVSELYLYAYFGTNSWEISDTSLYAKYIDTPILYIKDSSLFSASNIGNCFCYSLMLPPEKGTRENLQKTMQRDLQAYFGFEASIESRATPYWRLISSEGAATKLITRGGKQSMETIIPRVSLKYTNVSMTSFVRYLSQFTHDIIIDETGITQNIDIITDCTDLESVRAFLPKYGLKLVRGEKEMKVLVIRDAKN